MIRPAVALSCLLLLAGCAGMRLSEEINDLPASQNLESVPFHPQTEYHCGPAALATVLEHSGVPADYDALIDQVYIPSRSGSLQVEMTAATRANGRIAYHLPPRPEAVFREVAAGRPVLVLENLGLKARPVWHYAVVVGFDQSGNQVIERSGPEKELRVGAGRWLRRWNRAGRWAMLSLRPGEWPAQPERRAWVRAAADFEAAADAGTALIIWRQTVERWPREPIALLGIGNAHFALDDFEAAADAYQRLLNVAPDHAAGRFNLAVALERTGRPCAGLALLHRLEGHPQLGSRAADKAATLASVCRGN